MSLHEEARVSAIVLAAGDSRRMGGGRQKLLMDIGGRTVIERVVGAAVQSRAREVMVVTGTLHEQFAEVLGTVEKARLVRNPDPSRGMLSSVRCGLEAIDPLAHGVAVLPGDQPGVTPETVNAVIDAWSGSARTIAVPKTGDRRGHPLIFDIIHAEEVRSRFDDMGLRGLLAAHPDAVLEVPLASPAVLEDIDTPEDYQRLSRLLVDGGHGADRSSAEQGSTLPELGSVRGNYFAALPIRVLPGALHSVQESAPGGLRWFHPEDLHITLAFFGREDPARVPAILEVLEGIPFARMSVALGKLRPLPNPRSFSALAFEIADADEAHAVANLIAAWRAPLCEAAGVEPEKRRPLPHLTIARPSRGNPAFRRKETLAWLKSLSTPSDPAEILPPALFGWSPHRPRKQFRVIGRR